MTREGQVVSPGWAQLRGGAEVVDAVSSMQSRVNSLLQDQGVLDGRVGTQEGMFKKVNLVLMYRVKRTET